MSYPLYRSLCRAGSAALALALFAPPPAAADPGPGDLLVAPTRVVLEGRTRNAEITLVNLGATPATYRVGLIELRMDAFGGSSEIAPGGELPGERFSSSMIRFSPRQVRLEPQVAQTVRISLRKPEGLEAGEYRSHLLFRAVPEGVEPAPEDAAATGLEVRLRAIYGVSIPVIVRHGETAAEVRLGGLRLEPATPGEGPRLAFRLERSGNRSVYGNLLATWRPPGGKPVTIGEAHGLAVYTPNPDRSGFLALQAPPGAAPLDAAALAGEIELSYRTPTGELLAEAVLALP